MDYAGRVDELAQWMRERDLHRVLLFERDNIRYFAGFQLNRAASSILMLEPDGGVTYIVPQLDARRAKRDCWMERILAFPEDTPNYLTVVAPLLRGTSKVGVERGILTLSQRAFLQELVGPSLVLEDVGPFLAELRLTKTADELAMMREAAAITDRVMEALLKEVAPGVTENELVGLVEYLLRREGAEGPSFEAFVMTGENAWLPQRVGSSRALCDGDLGVVDMGARYNGYCSDLTRTFAVGDISPEQERLFLLARASQEAALEAVRPGVQACQVHQAAWEVVQAAGHGEHFLHLTGHGVGVSIHEAPILDEGVRTVLRPNMVVTVEPGLYVPSLGAARVEDLVLVTDGGCELLSGASRDLG